MGGFGLKTFSAGLGVLGTKARTLFGFAQILGLFFDLSM